jgi:hypothetical protein
VAFNKIKGATHGKALGFVPNQQQIRKICA